jgi:hypothetical protein
MLFSGEINVSKSIKIDPLLFLNTQFDSETHFKKRKTNNPEINKEKICKEKKREREKEAQSKVK